ncbi:MAG: bifunctional riboflavin kinase/FAD synthetase [Aquificae bacterium]|nr:bifunctional riboflavin kinase/FAD synthetase [Aquificota bacterium]
METLLLEITGKERDLPPLRKVRHLREKTAIIVGNFDGVHLGHRYLVDLLKEKARERNLKTLVLTFFPHPLRILAPQILPCELTNLEEKILLLEESSPDFVVVINFTEEFARIPARKFLEEVLYRKLGCRYLLVGYDWRYGHRREGEVELAKEVGKELGFEVEEAPPFKINGHVVSSTLVRRLLKEGRVEEVKKYLGHNYWIKRRVVRGEGRGTKIGFPTANLSETNNLCLKEGVYLVKVEDSDYGLANYGFRPTFGGKERVLEVHLLDKKKDLRDKKIKVEFLRFLRPERRFSSVQELVNQIEEDVKRARELVRDAEGD